jgi:16S rRNA G527 N7-methylase RsmG
MSNFIKRVKNYDTVVSLYEKTSNVKIEEGYGELLMTGVEQLSDFITSIATTNKNKISQSDFFLDVGSGYGKLLIHLSLINDFGKLFGVEKDLDKYEFSKNLKSEFQANNVIFINDDIKNIDVSKVNWIFMNDVLFSKEDSQYVFDNAKPGTHIISFLEGFRNAQDNSEFDCNWYPFPVNFNYYQI